ncbi:MAG: DUF2914 domain-containing protein [Endomicrobia bacterium]|nr:DUF2914 domain-containing protein [Endomicrobiia bacterium]
MRKVSLLLAFAVMIGAGSMVFAQNNTQQAAQEKSKSALTVTDSAVCTAIADRMPEGKAAEFGSDVTKVYYWTKIEGATENTPVKHVWYAGDAVIGEVPLTVTTSPFRTWSSKTLYPGLSEMSVEVVDADGNVLKKDTFTVKQ